MKFFKNIFGVRNSTKSAKNTEAKNEKPIVVPGNKSSWYLIQTDTLSKEFEFLITSFGFEVLMKELVGHEYWTVYGRESIKIEIWGDVGDLPFVLIRNTELPYDESKHLDNRDNIDDFNSKAKKIRLDWNKRREPLNNIFMDEWSNNDNIDFTELNKDYENLGKQEHKEYLHEAATTVRENIELKKGKLKNVT